MATLGKFFVEIGSRFDSKGLDKASQSIKNVGKQMMMAGTAFTAVFGVIAIKGIKVFGDFDAGMREIATMLDEVGKKRLPEFADGIKKMSVLYGEATGDLQRGLYDILSAGIDASKAMNVLDVSVKMGKASLVSAGVAADALTTIINAYGLESEKAADISDLLFSIVKKGKTTMDAIAPAIGRVAAIGATAGLSLEDMGASLSAMTAAGIGTNEAVTALNGIVLTFLKPLDESVKVAKQFGLEMNVNTLRTIGLTGVLKKLEGATEAQVASIFSNQRALMGMSSLLGDVEGFTKDYDAMLNRTGVTLDAFEVQQEGVNYQLAQMKETINVLWIEIGESLVPVIIDLMDEVKPLIKDVIKWVKENNELTKSLITTGLKVGVITVALGGLLFAVGAVIPKIKIFYAVIAAHPFVAIALAIAGITLAIEKMISAKHNAIAADAEMTSEMTKTTDGRIKLMKREIQALMELMKGRRFNLEEAEENQKKMKALVKALSFFNRESEAEDLKETSKAAKEKARIAKELAEKQLKILKDKAKEEKKEIKDVADTEKESLAERIQNWIDKHQAKLENTAVITSQLMETATAFQDFMNVKIENNMNKSIDAETLKYETKLKWIEANITDEGEKAKAIEDLEQGHSAAILNIKQHAADEERKRRKALKPFKIAEAIVNTAVAVTEVLPNLFLAALIAIQGAFQVAKISAQKFAEGGMVLGPTLGIFGERGDEVALPLEHPNTIKALSGALQLAMAGGGIGGGNVYITMTQMGSRREARRQAEIIGDEMFRKVQKTRRM